MLPGIALIVDIVGSRELDDRPSAQEAILAAFAIADEVRPFRQRLAPTFADEFQAVFDDAPHAVWATAVGRLLLPEGIDCRFGLGAGELREVGPGLGGTVQDGSAWWRARAAIEEAHGRQDRRNPYLRTWFDGPGAPTINALLLLRDAAIDRMRARERRIAGAALLGRSQVEIARAEGVTQSAVSQSLRRSGAAALVAADVELRREAQGSEVGGPTQTAPHGGR